MPIFGLLAMCASLTLTILGFPAQIWKNYRKKNCDGVSPVMVICAMIAYTFFGLYGWTKPNQPDWFLAISQTIGFLATLTLLIQIIYYKHKKPA